LALEHRIVHKNFAHNLIEHFLL
ncbi:hypothetical protein OLQ09_06135, partial [Campylobacter jejuni]|nr:hypothetical protein [Campylobacter jejuni]